MAAKITCPVCQSKYGLEEAARTGALKEMVGLAAKFGRTWDLVEEYVSAFRQSQYGAVGLTKRVRVLNEILHLWEGLEFVYQGKLYRTDHVGIKKAMTVVCNADKFGFRNHNYLKKILLAEAERVSAEGLTAAEERRKEEKKKYRSLSVSGGLEEQESRGDGEAITLAEHKRREVEGLAGKV